MNIKFNSITVGAAIKTGTEVINRAGAILLIPVFTRLMTPADYGVVNLVSTFSAIIALLSLGFPVAQQVNYHRLKDRPEELGAYIFTTNLVAGLAMAVVAVILLFIPWSQSIVRWLLGTTEIHLFPHIALGIGLGVCTAFSNLTNGFLNIRRQFHIQSMLSITAFLLTTGISLYLLKSTHLGPSARLWGLFLGTLLPLAFSLHLYLRHSVPHFRMDYLKDAWIIGWPAALNWGIFLIINQSDRIILSHYLSLETVGHYTLAFTVAQGMSVVVQSVAQSYSPLFMETANRTGGDVRSLESSSRAAVLIVLAIGLLASAWLPYLVHWLLPPKFAPTVTFLPCLTGALGMYIVFNLVSLNYNFRRKTLFMPAFTIFAASLSAGLNLTFVPRFGEHATAINALATYFLLSVVTLVVTKRIFGSLQFSVGPTITLLAGYSGLVLLGHFTTQYPILHAGAASLTTVVILFKAKGLYQEYTIIQRKRLA